MVAEGGPALWEKRGLVVGSWSRRLGRCEAALAGMLPVPQWLWPSSTGGPGPGRVAYRAGAWSIRGGRGQAQAWIKAQGARPGDAPVARGVRRPCRRRGKARVPADACACVR